MTKQPGGRQGSSRKKSTSVPKRASARASESITLHWDLHELPSSQHRAGLAGLALSIRFLERKSDRKGVCRIEELSEKGLTIAADREGMQSLFDDVYAASLEEQEREKPLQKKRPDGSKVDIPPKYPPSERVVVDPISKKERTRKVFIYDQVIPRGSLIEDWDVGHEGKKLWLKLWRDMVWSILRGVPATREPFEARAEGREIEDGAGAWEELATKPQSAVELPSTYALGAQARNAENVGFEDRTRFRFLLHFWPAVVAIYVPAVLQRDGKRQFVGYALAIPDVALLDAFVDTWEQVARRRRGEPAGYVPRDAVVDLAAEAGLDVVRRSNEVLGAIQGSSPTADWLGGVDVFHVEREGNNVRIRSVVRVIPRRRQDDEYARVRGANYWSSVFRRQRVGNVIAGKPWWSGFASLCSTTPEEMTRGDDRFRHDCRLALTEVEMREEVPEADETIEHLIYRCVQAYVLGKTERKYNVSWRTVQGNATQEKEYREKRDKVAREAFLAVRSRSGADFVAYFTSTLCSVPQHANEARYLKIARSLTDPKAVEQVRSLTLLALSAVA